MCAAVTEQEIECARHSGSGRAESTVDESLARGCAGVEPIEDEREEHFRIGVAFDAGNALRR